MHFPPTFPNEVTRFGTTAQPEDAQMTSPKLIRAIEPPTKFEPQNDAIVQHIDLDNMAIPGQPRKNIHKNFVSRPEGSLLDHWRLPEHSRQHGRYATQPLTHRIVPKSETRESANADSLIAPRPLDVATNQ
jgi:hypothetical protein